ncbi:hypothetical protein [Gandjariella thermophila]|uniref:Uncharacterized protein n=1 Tax=Gandjariella thermophila TaxID=1931992 RepID=A0A4D4J608_9PSEU|nr:hypothetical protein [Gandjariella thermophila]GDY30532.1 hypothetical protein GTS_21650 [Gandjariella thermophila]
MTRAPRFDRSTAGDRPGAVGRRGVLRAGMLLPLAGAAAACSGSTEPEAPDPLIALAAQARSDVAAANGVAAAHPDLADAARLVAGVRQQHATALQQEVDRLHPPSTSATPPPAATSTAPPAAAQVGTSAARTALATALATAEQQASNLVPTLPRYRAGLVGSVAAGCAALREVLS